jgi:hypothetical protein
LEVKGSTILRPCNSKGAFVDLKRDAASAALQFVLGQGG